MGTEVCLCHKMGTDGMWAMSHGGHWGVITWHLGWAWALSCDEYCGITAGIRTKWARSHDGH